MTPADISGLTKPAHVLVRFDGCLSIPGDMYYEAWLVAERVQGRFYRFDARPTAEGKSDEVHGWKPLESFVIEMVFEDADAVDAATA